MTGLSSMFSFLQYCKSVSASEVERTPLETDQLFGEAWNVFDGTCLLLFFPIYAPLIIRVIVWTLSVQECASCTCA